MPDLEQPAFVAWAAAGFGEDLVLISAPDASGNSPGKRPLLDDWQRMEVTPSLVVEWSQRHANVGLRTQRNPAIDIDVDDLALADAIERVVVAQLGPAPRRVRSNSARRALLFRLEGDPFPKAALRFALPSGTFAKVEILGDGQQLVVAGGHPSGVALQWGAGVPQRADVPPMSLGDRDAVLAAIRTRLTRLGCVVDGRAVPDAPRVTPRMRAPESWVQVEPLVEAALAKLDPDMDYERWVKVGMALHAKDPDPGGHGFYAWDGWSAAGQKYPGQEKLVAKWRTFNGDGGVHFASLLHMAGIPGRLPAQEPPRARPEVQPDDAPPPEEGRRIIPANIPLVCASAVIETPVRWLIPNLLAAGELTDLAGDPGVGKGGIVASWTKGILDRNPGATVIIFQTEDRLGHVRARLRAEGADLDRVFLLDIMQPNASPIFPGDAPVLEALIRERRALFVAFDPALEFLDASLDSHRQQDVQRFCAALADVSHRTAAGILTVRHWNKTQKVGAIYRASGSIAFVARARMALMASKDKEAGTRVLAVTKGNIGRDAHAVAYEIVERDGSTVIAWGDTVAITADELANQDPAPKRGRPATRASQAAELLRLALKDGPVQIDELVRQALDLGISRRTLFRARDELGLSLATVNLKNAWRLPSSGTGNGG